VDLYLNRQYHGTYLMTEKIEVNEHRVNIFDLEAANEAANPDQPLDSYKRVGELEMSRKGKYKAFDLPADPDKLILNILRLKTAKDELHPVLTQGKEEDASSCYQKQQYDQHELCISHSYPPVLFFAGLTSAPQYTKHSFDLL
jgi:hypothetical protein